MRFGREENLLSIIFEYLEVLVTFFEIEKIWGNSTPKVMKVHSLVILLTVVLIGCLMQCDLVGYNEEQQIRS
jgi:hypothetical protein